MGTMRQSKLQTSLGDDWEDVVQEANLRCLRYQHNQEYERILTTVIRNVALDVLVKRKQDRKMYDQISAEDRQEAYTPNFGLIEDVRRVLRKHWNQKERDAIFLYFTGQASLRDIQKDLGKSTTDTHRFMGASIVTLKEELEDYAP